MTNNSTDLQIERRRFKRYNFYYPLKLKRVESENYIPSFCKNISLGGMLLSTKINIEKANNLNILFPYDSLNDSPFIKLNAKVVWVQNTSTNDQNNKIGIEFIDIHSKQNEILNSFIEGYCKKSAKITKDSNPLDAREFFIKGVTNYEENLYAALAAFTHAIQNDPCHIAAYMYRAFVKDRLGDSIGAKIDYDRVKKLSGQ